MLKIISVVAAEFFCFCEVGLSFYQFTEFLISEAAIVVRLCIIRIEFNGFVVILNRPLVLFQILISETAIVVRLCIIRIEFKRLVVVLNRLLVLS